MNLSLVRACHPEPTVAVTAVAAGIAVSVGMSPGGTVLVAAAVLSGQLVVGWLNDYLDAERDQAVGRRDKPVAAGIVSRRVVGISAACAGVACVPLSLATGLLPGFVHLIAVLSAILYDVKLKATVVSVLPYTVSFGLLPAFVVLAAGTAPPWWLIAAGALLGSGAHFANAAPDLDDDLATGVRGLPQRIGRAHSSYVSAVLLVAAMVVLVFAPPGTPTAIGLVLLGVVLAVFVAGAVASRRIGSRALFRSVMVSAVLAVALLVLAP